MPLAAMSAAEIKGKLAMLDPDLRFIFEDSGVSELAQAHLAGAATDVAKFKNLVDAKVEWRKLMLDFFQLGTLEDGLAGRSEVAAIMAAWESADCYKNAKDKSDAEDRLLGRPKALKQSTFLQTRKAFEKIHGELNDSFVPARGLVETLCQQLEEGDFRAEPLDELPSIEECPEDEVLTPLFGRDMVIKFKRGHKLKNKVPANPEELRRRLRILGNAYLFMAIRHPLHAVIGDVSKEMWSNYADWLNGGKVSGMKINNDRGEQVAQPSWTLVLSYELQVRKRMALLMNTEGISIAKALKSACEDSELRSEHFHSPFAVSAKVQASSSRRSRSRSRRASGRRSSSRRTSRRGRSSSPKGDWNKFGQPRAKSKGGWNDRRSDGGKGQPSEPGGGKVKLHVQTPDKQRICFAFNNRNEKCKKKKCDMVHVCQLCLGEEKTNNDPHPFYVCPRFKNSSGGKAKAR